MGCFAVRLGGDGGGGSSNVVWTQKKAAPHYSSPLFVDGLVYSGDDNGVVSCLEAKNGEIVWQKRVGGAFTPSPIYGDGKMYFFTEEGKCYVIAPGRQYNLVATNKLSDGMMASAAIAGNSLIIRTKEAVLKIQE